ncbi:MAG: penicillin-binding transpeptidase domain-containing protein, partial [Chthoniobacteraceae bacterium]
KSPNNLSPWRNRKACIDARNRVLERMLELKLISDEEYTRTIEQDLLVKNRRPIHQESYAAQLVSQQVQQLVGYDKAVSEGYRIYTTIDGDLQKKAETALREQLASVERREGYEHQKYADYDQMIRSYRRKVANGEEDPNGSPPEPEYLQGAALILNNQTGGILTLVGGRDISHSEYDRAVSARRPAGTAFKPLVYAAAFEKGLFPGTLLQDAVIDNRQVMIGGTTGILGEWGPERVDNTYEGSITARTALVKSKNAATVRLGMSTGIENVTKLAKTAGIESPLRPFPATFLGSSEVTLMEMVLANTSFPNGGTRPEKPFIIDRIEEQSGRVIFQASSKQQRVMRPTTAYEVHSCLTDVLERGTADKAYTEYGLKRQPMGGKTGTAYNFTDVWFVGYSSEITCGVWAGFDKPRTPIYRGAFSNEVVLPVWSKLMGESFARYKPQAIAQPKGLIKVELCSASGLLATAKCEDVTEDPATGEKVARRTTYFEIATDAQAPTEGCPVHGDVPTHLTQTRPGATPGVGGPGNPPKALPAADLKSLTPVVLKAPTIIGKDPYNSDASVANAMAMKDLGGPGQVAPIANDGQVPAEAQGPVVEVRKAVAPGPLEQSSKVESPIKLPPPPALDF